MHKGVGWGKSSIFLVCSNVLLNTNTVSYIVAWMKNYPDNIKFLLNFNTKEMLVLGYNSQ